MHSLNSKPFRRLLVTLVFCTGLGTHVFAGYNFNATCLAAYRAAWALKPVDVSNYLSIEKSSNPGNSVPLYLANLSQFTEVFSSENRAAFEKFKNDKETRLNDLNSTSKTPWYRFCRAEIYLQSAVLKVKFSEYLSAAYEFNKAYNNLTSCVEDFPDFLPAQKDLLLLKAVVGTVPENYRWMLKIIGFSGDVKTSMAKYDVLLGEMEKSKQYYCFTGESRIIYAYLCFAMLNDPQKAWQQMDAATKDYATNPLSAFVRGNLALRLKKTEVAITAFAPHVENQPGIPALDYMMGIARLQRGDKNSGFYFGRYIKNYKGEHYIKDAYLKMGWSFLLARDTKHFKSSMDMVAAYGTTQLEEDKNALKEATLSAYAVPEILRARLYFDGGYLDKALVEIKKTSAASLATTYQKGEYYYRYARIVDALKNENEALANYQTVIDKYSGLANYFAPASCLYAGVIWEKRNNKEKARAYFKQCIAFHAYIYKDSFDQKAYSGLKRVE